METLLYYFMWKFTRAYIDNTNVKIKFELERHNIFISKMLPPGWDYLSLVVDESAA